MNSVLAVAAFVSLVAVTFAWKNQLVNRAANDAEIAVHNLLKRSIELDKARRSIRKRRQVGCVLQCVQTMSRNMQGIQKDASSGLVDPKLFNQTKFNELCDIYKAGKTCLDTRCADDAIKTTLTAAFKSLDYLCIDHYDEFIQHTTCYVNSQDEVSERCTPLCGDQTAMAALKARQEHLKRQGSTEALSQIRGILGCMCRLLDCHVTCNVPIYDAECGSDAPGRFIKEFASTTFRALGDLMHENGVEYLWPRESCGRIGSGRFGFAENTNCVNDYTEE